ncbi:MAG: endolytic transglycosylase MltG [Chloroflexota bacterium]
MSIRRVLVMAGLASIALLSCIVIVAVILLRSPTNSRLNPIESAILRVSLSSRDKDLKTAAGTDAHPICFTVSNGDTASTIGATLVKQGFIKDADLFKNYARYYGIDAQLQAGIYSLRKTLTIPEIAQMLTNAGADTVKFQVIEGRRIEEIAQQINTMQPPLAFRGEEFALLVGSGAASRSDFARTFAMRVGLPNDKSLEGFLFPDTYELPACAKSDELVQRMLQNFDNKVTAQMRTDAQAQNLSMFQVITLASIVEREAVVADERPVIAGVYLNRLRVPMKLDADPTVQYALGNSRDPKTWWPQITSDDYNRVVNPYNTYLNASLPPGPIANPGLSSIQAVLKPQASSYLYFRATCTGDGRHKFANTFEEQVANGC